MSAVYIVCEPARFEDWGGDGDIGPGSVWEEFIDEVERRRCERWAGTWLFLRDMRTIHVWGGVSQMSESDLEQLVRNGHVELVSAERFEAAWSEAVATGIELFDLQEDKGALVRGGSPPSE